jgi:hypothetical protein
LWPRCILIEIVNKKFLEGGLRFYALTAGYRKRWASKNDMLPTKLLLDYPLDGDELLDHWPRILERWFRRLGRARTVLKTHPE